jgi:multiple sugar transport system permease protein
MNSVGGQARGDWRQQFMMLRRAIGKLAFWLLVLAMMSSTLFIFFWMLSLSFKTQVENTAYPPIFLPKTFHFENYFEVFRQNPFLLYTLNSLIVGVGSTGLSLLFGVPAAYGIVKWNHYGMALAVLVARLVPALSFLIPWFILFRNLGLSDSYITLILTHMVVGLPIVVWIMIGFFEDIHPELEEAALVDGCSPFGTFFRIALPLALPGLAVAGILAFILSWNNFVFSVVLAGPDTRPLPVAVFNMMSYEQVVWGPLAAAALIVTLPVLVMTLAVQRYIVVGLAAGGIKG